MGTNLPSGYLERIGYIIENYGESMLRGAGSTLLIAFVGTAIGCIIGFISLIITYYVNADGNGENKKACRFRV